MDDILSAALGQSGLNFSFLEDQDDKPSSSTTSSQQHQQAQQQQVASTGNVPVSSNLSLFALRTDTDNIFKDDTEDVTELLNLLDDTEQDKKNLSASGASQNSKGGKDDVLDFLLKFQSDDESLSGPNSPVPSPLSILSTSLNDHNNIKRTAASSVKSSKPDLDSRKLISITSKFPKINSTQPTYINIKTANNKIAKLTFPKANIVQRLAANNNKSTISVKTTTLSSLSSAKQIVIRTTPNNAKIKESTVTRKSNVSCLKTSTKSTADSSKMLSEDDKKKLSIQHVLASPNLTYREKQFLMKKALSANIKPSHPTLSTTVK